MFLKVSKWCAWPSLGGSQCSYACPLLRRFHTDLHPRAQQHGECPTPWNAMVARSGQKWGSTTACLVSRSWKTWLVASRNQMYRRPGTLQLVTQTASVSDLQPSQIVAAVYAARFCPCRLFEGLCQNVQQLQLQPTRPPENIRCYGDGLGKWMNFVPSCECLGTGKVEISSAQLHSSWFVAKTRELLSRHNLSSDQKNALFHFHFHFHFSRFICHISNFVFHISYFISHTSYFVLRTSYFVLRTSYFVLRTSYFVLRTSYFVLRTSYFILHYFILHTSYFILHTSYFILHTSYFILHTSFHSISFSFSFSFFIFHFSFFTSFHFFCFFFLFFKKRCWQGTTSWDTHIVASETHHWEGDLSATEERIREPERPWHEVPRSEDDVETRYCMRALNLAMKDPSWVWVLTLYLEACVSVTARPSTGSGNVERGTWNVESGNRHAEMKWDWEWQCMNLGKVSCESNRDRDWSWREPESHPSLKTGSGMGDALTSWRADRGCHSFTACIPLDIITDIHEQFIAPWSL